MVFIISFLMLLIGFACASWAWRQTQQNGAADSTMADVRLLREIDQKILSDLSLEYLAQEVADLVPSTGRLLGATLRVVDPDGTLRVLAVSQTLDSPDDGRTLHQLSKSILSPAEIARDGSKLAQVLNQRQVVTGTAVAEFEQPTLTSEIAAQIQAHFEIKGIVAFPVLADNAPVGVLTFYLGRGPAQITSHDHELMQGITGAVGVAIGNARLASQVDTVNRQLSEASSHLTELDALKDDFIAVASHQLRSPLTAIKGYLSMLVEGDYGPVPDSQQVVVEQLKRSTNEVINLVNDMLSVSRINAEKLDLVTQPTELCEIVRDVVAELAPLAKDKNLTLSVDLPEPCPAPLEVDPLRIRQVILNLVDNAIKYTPSGSVAVSLREADHAITLTVADTGIGIPDADRGKLFGKFYRAANAKSRIVNGSGLGLFVVKEIVTRHGGTIDYAAGEKGGTAFTVRLPRREGEAKVTSPVQPESPSAASV